MDLEKFMKKEGWVMKCYWNGRVPYFAWHKDGVQIDECDVNEIDNIRNWETKGAENSSIAKVEDKG